MIVCPKCKKCDWKCIHKSILYPEDDKFRCNSCGTVWKTYDGTPRQDKKPESDESK